MGGGTTTPPPATNVAPTVSLSATATVGTALALSAATTDTDGTVAKVEFFSGTTKLGEDLSAPYAFTPAAASTLSLTARATDNAATAPAPRNVAVSAPATAPPTTGGSTTGGPANATFFRAVNLGGNALTIDGRPREASAGATNFTSNPSGWASPAGALSHATDAARAEMLRSAHSATAPAFALGAVPAASYAVYVYIWENNSPETTNVLVEGAVVRSGGNVNVSGIEVWRLNAPAVGAVSPMPTATPTTVTIVTASIDPVTFTASPNHFDTALRVNSQVKEPETADVALFDAVGTAVLRQKILLDAQSVLTLATNDLPKGLYTLKILSGSQRGQSMRVEK